MFGELVRGHRLRLGLTQEELASKAGLSARNIRDIEAGRIHHPRLSTVRLLAEALELSPAERELFRPAEQHVTAAEDRTANCLPRPATHFGGRDRDLTHLLEVLGEAVPDRPLVLAVSGMPGVGKTALAVHLARTVADRYPAGQLFVDLHGHSSTSPVEPAVALGLLLAQLGVPAHEVPDAVEARAARWRAELAGRRLLVVLDNAADTDQLKPLLPGQSAALVLVTSRRRLVALDSDAQCALEPLDDEAAVALLARVIGERRVSRHADEAREVARLCGNLPLALRLTAARLLHRPSWTVANLAERLRSTQPPVVEVAAEGVSVAAALSVSYRQLTAAAQRMLRLLGLHPGEDFDEYAAAALADAHPTDVRPVLEDLLDAHLVQEPSEGRYRLHDLIRDYAGRLVSTVDDSATRHCAARRLLEYYLHSSVAELPDGTSIDGLHTPDWGPVSPHRRVFANEAERIRWEETEWRNVLAAADLAEQLGMDRLLCLLARAAWGFHWRRGNAGILIRLHEAALAAARRLGDRSLTAMVHNYLAGAYTRSGQMVESRHHLNRSIDLWRAVGDETAAWFSMRNLMTIDLQGGRFEAVIAHGRWLLNRADPPNETEPVRRRLAYNRALALRQLAECHTALGEYRTALHYLRQATRCYSALGLEGYRWAFVLSELGRAHARLGHGVVAPLLLRRALAHFERSGNQIGVAEVLAELGIIHLRDGRMHEAMRLHELAVERIDRAGSPQGRCYALNRLGGTRLRAGDAKPAAALFREALLIAERVGFRYEEAVAHAGLSGALRCLDAKAAEHHGALARRLFDELGAVDPYHMAGAVSAPPLPGRSEEPPVILR